MIVKPDNIVIIPPELPPKKPSIVWKIIVLIFAASCFIAAIAAIIG